MPVGARTMIQVLTGKLRFQQSERRHHWFSRTVNDNEVTTEISHGAREIGDVLLGLMARQLRLTPPQLRQAIDCTRSEADYTAILIQHFPGGPGQQLETSVAPALAQATRHYETLLRAWFVEPEHYEQALRESEDVLLGLGLSRGNLMRIWHRIATTAPEPL